MNNDLKAGLSGDKTDSAKTAVGATTKEPGDPAEKTAVKAGTQKLEVMKAVVTPGSSAYRIGAQDVIDIQVFKVAELSKSVQVSDTGMFTYPLLGEVAAGGKTAQDVEHDLTARLSKSYLQKPQVTVTVKEYNSQRVLMDGAVAKPGLYPVQGRTSLMQIIATSGGLNATADSTIVLFRIIDGKKSAARFDVEEIRNGSLPDPQVQAGDVIVVSTSQMKDGFEKFIKLIPLAGVFAIL